MCDSDTRRELFGDARIGVLYSGNFGEAHDFVQILDLARQMRSAPEVHFCFAVRGNRAASLREAVTSDDINVSFAGFASIEDLEKRLGSADIHLVSLKKEWTGIAVPSKFFGSIAAGRPILYSGPHDSAIGNWIRKYRLGWIIDPNNIAKTSHEILEMSSNQIQLKELQEHCHDVYQRVFSREIVMRKWDAELRALIADQR